MTITKNQYNKLLQCKKNADKLNGQLKKIDKFAQKILKTEDKEGYIADYLFNGYDISYLISGLGIKVV